MGTKISKIDFYVKNISHFFINNRIVLSKSFEDSLPNWKKFPNWKKLSLAYEFRFTDSINITYRVAFWRFDNEEINLNSCQWVVVREKEGYYYYFYSKNKELITQPDLDKLKYFNLFDALDFVFPYVI